MNQSCAQCGEIKQGGVCETCNRVEKFLRETAEKKAQKARSKTKQKSAKSEGALIVYDASKPSPFGELPVELCLHILSYLDFCTRCKLGMVCRLFRVLSMDNSSFHTIRLNARCHAEKVLTTLIPRYAPFIYHLDLSNCTNLSPTALSFLANTPNLRSLSLPPVVNGIPVAMFSNAKHLELALFQGCQQIEGPLLLTLTANSQKLKTLELVECKISGPNFTGALAALPKLQSLTLQSCNVPQDSIFQAIGALKELRVLRLRQQPGLANFPPNFFNRLTQLSVLDLNRCTTLLKEDIYQIGEDAVNLTELDLVSVPNVDNRALGIFAERLKKLAVLSLDSNSNFSDIDIGAGMSPFLVLKKMRLFSCKQAQQAFMAKLAQCKTINELDLSYTNLDDRCIEALLKNGVYGNLTNLNVSSTQITDASLFLLADHAPNLANLSLKYCKITDTGIMSLTIGCRNMETLDLRSCSGVTDECLEPMRMGFHKLKRVETLGTKIKNSSISALRTPYHTAPFFLTNQK